MSDLVGQTLGGYHIIEEIGSSGVATVLKAHQPSMDRYVALKVLSTQPIQDHTFIKRFQREAKVVARLEHLHILPVYDYGEEEGYLYLAMRFIEAGSLKDWLARGPLPLDETQRVVAQVGSALEYAHQQGVIHRDLKPSSVLIDSRGDCYLTDFGIVKLMEGTQDLTGSGIIGTPKYMAPEQGQSLRVDHRADIYAMGVVIYEMVTGQLPFDADIPLAMVMKHINEPPPLPRSIKPDLPEAVERVILKALAKAPADRYQSMRDLVAAFDQAMHAILVEASITTPLSVAPAPVVVEEAEVPATKGGLAPALFLVWQRGLSALLREQMKVAQPPWLLAAIGLILLVLVGIILSRQMISTNVSGIATQPTLAIPAIVSRSTFTSTPPPMLPTPTPMYTPIPPTPTKPPATPTLLPFALAGTPVPQPETVISPENAHQVTQLARWGKGDIRHIVWSPNSQTLAVASSIGVHLYYVHTLQPVQLTETNTRVTSVAFASDGIILASGLSDGTVWLWQLSNRALLHVLTGHARWVKSVTFSRDGRMLASGAGDGTVRLWGVGP